MVMPTYRDPRTGEEITLVGDGNEWFYLNHGWEIVGSPYDNPNLVAGDINELENAIKGKRGKAAPAEPPAPPMDKPLDEANPSEGGD
jgi:hypothetical protein